MQMVTQALLLAEADVATCPVSSTACWRSPLHAGLIGVSVLLVVMVGLLAARALRLAARALRQNLRQDCVRSVVTCSLWQSWQPVVRPATGTVSARVLPTGPVVCAWLLGL